MRIKINGAGHLTALEKRFLLEGDEIVNDNPELVLCANGITGAGSSTRHVLGEWVLPQTVLDGLGITPIDGEMDFFVSKWHSSTNGFSPQTVIGLPIRHLLPSMLGSRCVAGVSLRYIHSGPLVGLFLNEQLIEVLNELSYNGFVTFGLVLDVNFSVCSLQTGVPFHGVLPLLEGSSGRLASFLSSSMPRFRESWTTGLVLSTGGWPFLANDHRIFIKPLSDGWQKHFWSWTIESFRESMFSDSRLLGVATGWSQTLHESIRRCKLTLRNLDVLDKQYNPSPGEELTFTFHRLLSRGLIDPM